MNSEVVLNDIKACGFKKLEKCIDRRGHCRRLSNWLFFVVPMGTDPTSDQQTNQTMLHSLWYLIVPI